ncbi:MAG TPA: sialidase family protein, partial [Geopsychrobacteraceae bacterium]
MNAIAQGSATPASGPVTLLIATRKGAWLLKGDSGRRGWQIEGPIFLGHIVHHMVLDPRDRRTLLMAARTGHLGPTVFRSADGGKSWQEASRPPAFPKAPEGSKGRVVDHVFWLSPGHPSEPGVW